MPWYMPSLTDAIKKRVFIYLLQRYLGQFLVEKLTLNQLDLDLYNGRGTIEKVSLDVQALNELGEKQNWPLEFVNGFLEKVYVIVPWSTILKDATFIEVHGLKLTVQPKQRNECATSMFESMWSSMTNSMQLAQECMKQEASNVDMSQPLEGIEIFAQAIDSILCRVKVKFVDTIIQLEHVPKDSLTGVGIIINIKCMEYLDEAGNDPPTGETTDNEQNKAFVVSSFTTKNFHIEGLSISTIEFPSRARTFSQSLISQSQDEDKDDSLVTMLQKNTLKGDDCPTPVNLDDEVDGRRDSFEEERHVITFAKFAGKQEIVIRLKQSEDVNGPKVTIQVNLGGLSLFLSPRQVFVLLELANGMSSPDIEDTSNVAPRQKCMEKPMTGLDYQRVEQELQQQLHPANAFHMPGLQGAKGWSTAALDESDNDDNFLPMRPTNCSSTMYDSAMSTTSSSMESSLSSSMVSSISETTSNRSRRRANNIDSDPTAEISQFNIKLASLVVVLLHEDLLTLSNETFTPSLIVSSVRQMQGTAEKFFSHISSVIITGYGKRNFDDCRTQFEKACNLNHLRLMAAPVQIECNETTTLTAFSLSGKLTAAKVELLECLKSADDRMEYVRLVQFHDDSSTPIQTKPCLKMSFKHIERTVKKGLGRKTYVPKTELGITLDSCTVEVDISLVDRICALLHPLPVCVIQKTQNIWGANAPQCNATSSPTTESQLDLKIASHNLTIKLRFPVPDYRPSHDMQKTPWWKRNVRPSFLSLQMTDASATTTIQTLQNCQKYVVQCKVMNVYYYEKENYPPLHIGKVGVDERLTSLQEGFNWPRFVIQIYPVQKLDYELEEHVDSEPDIISQSIYKTLLPTKRGPFSAKRVVHQSDAPHSKPQQQVEDNEELVIPGDKQEISDFIESTTKSAQIQLEINLPTITLQLASKHIYEVLYNHISSDLLLWEPSAPVPKSHVGFENNPYQINNLDVPETYAICKSGIQYESDSDSSDDVPNEYFYSVYETKQKMIQRKQQTPQPRGQSYLTLNLHIGQGLLCMNPPVRDLVTNVIPEQHGEFVLSVEEASIFSVSGYCGDEGLGYVCVQSKGAQLHHCNMITSSSQCPPLMEIGTILGKHLHPTIYKSDAGMLTNCTNRAGNREMLSVAVRIQASHETHHVKSVRVALGINKATLRHRMCLEPNSWITHLIDFFNVNDYTIPGYHAKDVLTELHLHLWDCAIDYRPFYIPIRSVVTLGTFSMSSHLSALSNTSTLRFLAEECGLFLSEKAPPRNGKPSVAPVDLKNDYVNVVDLGLFELSLRTNDKSSGMNPHIDLRASNNILYIRTCADSGRALTKLLTYFANDGDLAPTEAPTTPNSTYSSPRHNPENDLINVEPQDISNLSKSQHQIVNELLGDAMEESLSIEGDSNECNSLGTNMFFFPDEGQIIQEYGKPLPQVTTELGDVTFRSNKSSDTDDEFCIIGEEAGLGILPKNGLPEIRWLTDDPFHLIENHFKIPLGKTDILKPPKHYPIPVMRYTLYNMTVVWQMYGGNDFKLHDEDVKKEKKTVNFSDMREDVMYSNSRGEIIFNNFEQKKKPQLNWMKRGGVNRNHDILIELELSKVRFQHEVYPENTIQASRQVLLVTELEIRDLLQSSEINKLLYQHTSQARPKQSHAHMILIKAVHIRPDLKLKAQECSLRVSILPLRLNIDQDSLLFLIHFFNELSGTTTRTDEISTQTVSSKHSTPTHQPPVMTVSTGDDKQSMEQAQKLVDDNLLLLLDDVRNIKEEEKDVNIPMSPAENAAPIYFRNVIFTPDLPIKLDYHGKRLDLTHGPLAGLIMGLGQLNSSELRLRRLSNNHGVLGFDKLMTYCLQEWINDIKKNQLPSLLGGVGPMHSLVQFFQGIRDLFWLPIEQYQKDGRIVRGLQRGANSFTTSTAMAALELTSRIIHLIQLTAETAYDMMSPGPSVRRAIKSKGRKRRYNQPQDIREGMANAFNVVKEGFGEAAEHLVIVAAHEREQKGYSGAVGGVLRQIPPTFVKPIIIASEATNNVLGGMQSQLLPDSRREANQKWKNNDG